MFKTVLTALVLVACEPGIPGYGNCEMPPNCGQENYRLNVHTGNHPNISGALTIVDSLPLRVSVYSSGPIQTAFASGGGGRAYAMSCVGCEAYFDSFSIALSTDIVTAKGDTLKSGYNLTSIIPHPGISRSSSGAPSFRIDSLSGFRDSVFEVRFAGTIAGVQKSDTITLTIRNRDLILK